MCAGETPTRRGGRRRRRLDRSESVSPSFRLDLKRFGGFSRENQPWKFGRFSRHWRLDIADGD